MNLLKYLFSSYFRISLLIFSLFSSFCQAQNLKGTITDTNNQPLFGATVYNATTKIWKVTDEEGSFFMDAALSKNKIVVSFVGFESKEMIVNFSSNATKEIQMVLQSDSLDEVVVSGTLWEVTKTESPVPIELYTSNFFKAAPSASVFEAVENINGIRPQLNCNVCNTGDIHINGQEGANTMVLIDGLPNISGLSSVYGLTGIPQSLIDQLEVVKGPASTLYGSEATGGVINLITKIPQNVDPLSIESFVTSWGEINLDLATKYALFGGHGLLGINYFNYSNPVDNNGDGFTDLTLQHRISLFNKIQINRNSLAFRYFYEDRWGGQMNWTPKYRGGDEIYGESIYTGRFEVFGKLGFTDHLQLQYSLNHHDQNSVYGDTKFKALQTIGFLQATYSNSFNNHKYLLGVSYRYTNYNDDTPATVKKDISHLPGVFVQDEWKFHPSHTLLTGIRYDRNSIYGNIWTPRLNYKWENEAQTSQFRLGIGSGYRVVNVFTEDHAALTGTKEVVFEEEILPEKSWNINANWNQKIYSKYGYIFDIDMSLFKTEFSNRILPDYDVDPQKIVYRNLDGSSINQGATLNLSGFFPSGLRIVVGATYIDSSITEDNQTSRPYFTEKFTGNYRASYSVAKDRLKLDLTGSLIGPMKLPLLGPLDPRASESPTIHIMNIQATYKFTNIELYGGVKNIFDFKPPANSLARAFDPFDKNVDFDSDGNALATPNNPNALTFDPTYVYYSNQGIRTFLGLRYFIK